MFDPIMEQILAIARDAWAFHGRAVGRRGAAWRPVFRSAGHGRHGFWRQPHDLDGHHRRGWAGDLVLFAFLFLPQIGEMLKNFQPNPPF